MRNNALYFPYINIPEDDWLYLMLLYWDQLSSIAPSAAFYDRRELMPHMSILMKEGLVNFIEPSHFIEGNDEFGKPFLDFIKRRLKSGHRYNGNSIQRRWNTIGDNVYERIPIHIEKLGPVADELVFMKLATHANYPWYEMDKWAAEAFMAYLASFLGSLPEINSAPITNNETCFRLLGGYSRRKNKERTIQRYEILSKILPFPRDDLRLDKVIKFKEKYHEELTHFRDRIEGLSIDLANIHNPDDREDKRDIAIRELQQEMNSIASHMKETWREVVFIKILPILDALGSVITGIHTGEPLIAGLGALPLPTAIYQTIELRKNRQELLNHPIAYGVLLKREWQRLREGGRR